MREFKKGDVVRLVVNLTERTNRGVVRTYQSGHEFEVVSVADGNAKVKDATGCQVLVPLASVELVRSAHSPPDDDASGATAGDDGDDTGGGPVGKAAAKLGKRRGLVKVPEAA